MTRLGEKRLKQVPRQNVCIFLNIRVIIEHGKGHVRRNTTAKIKDDFIHQITSWRPEEKKRNHGYALLKTRVQEVPKAKSAKSRETDRILDDKGIVRRAGEWTPARHSGGTQYSKPPSGSLTQPLGPGCVQKSGRIGSEEEEGGMERCGDEFDMWGALSLSAEGVGWSLGEEERDLVFMVCPSRGLRTAAAVMAPHIRMVRSSDPEIMYLPSGE